MSVVGWLNMFAIRLTGDGTVWVVCTQCGVRVEKVKSGWTLADLYVLTEDHVHAQ